MQTIPLYRYNRPDGGVTVSPMKPDTTYAELVRLVADDGKLLTDGNISTPCVDTENPSVWAEINDPSFIDPNEATDTDYQNALRNMGVSL